eukprot:COSAG01_NODE_4461_length_5002_cov_2.196410_1_plen_69_part_10
MYVWRPPCAAQAQVLSAVNDDDNKVFSALFKTPPTVQQQQHPHPTRLPAVGAASVLAHCICADPELSTP